MGGTDSRKRKNESLKPNSRHGLINSTPLLKAAKVSRPVNQHWAAEKGADSPNTIHEYGKGRSPGESTPANIELGGGFMRPPLGSGGPDARGGLRWRLGAWRCLLGVPGPAALSVDGGVRLLLCAALDGGLPALFLVPVGQSFLQAISPARRQRAPVG